MKNIIITPSSFGECGSEPLDLIRANDFAFKINPYGRKLTEAEVMELSKGCVGIVAGVESLSKTVMDALPELKCISRVGVGLENIDLEYAKEKGIVVVNTPEGPTQSVAELTLGMVFALLRRIPQAHRDLTEKKWKKQIGNLLIGKKVGVIGLGRIGRRVAELFKALGNEVLGHDLYPDHEWASRNEVRLLDKEGLLKESDIITLHIPKGKYPFIGKEEIQSMKTSAFLVNVARGGVVDEDALFAALKSYELGGAALDVFSAEPYQGPLCDLDNVVLTPHIGSYAKESKLEMEIQAVRNLIAVLEGK